MKGNEIRDVVANKLRDRFGSCAKCGHLIIRDDAVIIQFEDKAAQHHHPTYRNEIYGKGCAPKYAVVHYRSDGSGPTEYFIYETLPGTPVKALVKIAVKE